MTINPTDTVRELAVAMPDATRVFEKLGIDYCCGGNRTLEDACRVADIPVEEAVRSLEGARLTGATEPPPTDWRQESLTALATHIVDEHHQFTRHELSRLDRLLKKVCAVHGGNHPELLRLREIFERLNDELTTHMLKEEQVLFPWVAKMEDAVNAGLPVPPPFFKTVRNPVRMMMSEHDLAGGMLVEMRLVTGDYNVPPDGCFSYHTLYQALAALEADLHEHIHLENNILFPRAVELEGSAEPGRQSAATGECEHHCFSH
ncbi:MAG TPA: iron-sulfur cluster repair di-iron protein [Blastocatellia bacterium]|nr:iron-sulfur cluster repair di-iron protein [Blastocatellia bacterium]